MAHFSLISMSSGEVQCFKGQAMMIDQYKTLF